MQGFLSAQPVQRRCLAAGVHMKGMLELLGIICEEANAFLCSGETDIQ